MRKCEVILARALRPWSRRTAVLLAAGCACFVHASGARQAGTPSAVSKSGFGAYEAALTAHGDGFATAWYDTRDGNPEIYFRVLDGDGTPSGPEHRVTDDPDDSYEADIVGADGDLILAWYDLGDEGYESWLARWSASGREMWRRRVSNPDRNGRIPVVRVDKDRVFVAWVEDAGERDYELMAGWWGLDGEALLAATPLMPVGSTTSNLNATIDSEGTAWLILDAIRDTRAEEVFLVYYAPDGQAAICQLTSDDGAPSKYPEVSLGFDNQLMSWLDRIAYWFHGRQLGADRVAVSWQDERDGNAEVYMSVVPADEVRNVAARARRVTDSPGETAGAYLRWNGPRLGLAWNDEVDRQQELFFQSFDTAGRPASSRQRLTETVADSVIPAIVNDGGGFALVWNEYTPSPDGIHGSPDARSEVFFTRVR